ncbi:unnamed protein product [Echinostoma caproni]|uniref:Uncharacterized protein n=1 Tax=Echinostoma caproni TaxID=27848 RepID=A0A3P8KHJ0_9TREM|nr:unnamed protein product [Echinostoma caproni]
MCTLSTYDPVTGSRTVRSKQKLTLDEIGRSAQRLSLVPGTQLKDLQISRIVGQIILLQSASLSNQLVFCRAINWDQTAKAVRAFLSHPPSLGTQVERTATVLFSASEDTGGRGSLHSRLAEVTFLEKSHIDIDDLVCGRLLHVGSDHWTLHLPNGAHGRLHLTAMLHSRQPQPISLTSPNAADAIIHREKQLGADLAKNRLITCRVVDRVEQTNRVCSGQSSSFLYYVCTNPLVLITHMDDMLIPIESSLCAQLRKAKIGFRVGDHLLVRPVRIFENQLVGELVFEGTVVSPSETELQSATKALIEHVAVKADRARKRLEHIKQENNTLRIFDESSTIGIRDKSELGRDESPEIKKPRMTNSDGGSDSAKRRRMEESSELFDPEVVQRYADFMLPVEFDSTEVAGSTQTNVIDEEHMKDADRFKKDNQSTREWRLHETEQRKAMLAALTAAQHRLPKGSLRPCTTEEFELAVRNAPSNAACWTAYMTHVLSGGDRSASINEARAIAERGLRAIMNAPGLEPGEQDAQQAHLLLVYLVLEAKELERCTQQKEAHTLYHLGSDPVLELNDQANRLSQVLSRLVNLDQAEFTRKAIETMADIGQFERAEDLARRLIKSCPQDVDRWLSLIKVRFRAGRVAAAREAQRNAVGVVRSVHLPRLLTGAARLEFEFGDADRSLTLFREQLSMHPKHRVIYEEFIKVLLLAGRTSEAKTVKEQAKESLKSHEFDMVENLFKSESEKNPAV